MSMAADVAVAPRPPGHALITGASAGLGAEFARQLAVRGQALILTARRVDRLQHLADTLRAAHAVDVRVVAMDLTDPGAPAALQQWCSAEGVQVDWLVNNAGYGLTGDFLSRGWDEHQAFLQVLWHAPLELCHRLLPGMCERGYGRIVNVASLAGLVPATAGHTLYGPVKAALVRFSQSLAQEVRTRGVQVSALCPGFTLTEFHDANGTRSKVSKMPRYMWMDAATVVRQGIAAVEQGRMIRVNGAWNRFVYALTKLLPDAWSLKLVASRSQDFRSQAPLQGSTER